MIRAPLSISSVLDEAAEAVALTASPWAGLVIATALPYRFALVLFIERLVETGSEATHYGDVLQTTAQWTLAAFVLSLWGRAVYARAIRLGVARGQSPGREVWRVPPAALFSYLFTASLAAFAFYAGLITLICIPLAIALGGLAIGTMELNDRAGVAAPLRLIARYSRESKILLAMVVIFVIGFFVAAINLYFLFRIGLWLAGGAGSFDLSTWELLLAPGNRRFMLLLLAGALVAIEPFWVAANVLLVRKAGAEESGEDLRIWFEELQRT